ncbi:MAG: multicopper oxidase family protein, partial [Nanoarchaeota archaeon]|nr:multicopper oxidase family protein [Nanoarchaeota archaeon]
MKYLKFLLLSVLLLFLAACSSSIQSEEVQSKEYSASELMMILHCQEMYMAGCEEYEGIELTQDQIKQGCEVMPSMSMCTSEVKDTRDSDETSMMGDIMYEGDKKSYNQFEMSTEGLSLAQESQVYNLKDGDSLDLSIDIVKKEIAGQKIRMFGYNGQIPGPLLRVKQDSTIYVNVTNNLDMETTVHWHGLRLDNENDGVPGSTMKSQQPGTSFEYMLDFPDEGIYWYHPHVREDIQQELGLYGNMLVDSKYSNYYNTVNKEIPLVVDDISIQENGQVEPFYKNHTTKTLMGRFGNVMLVNGDDDYSMTFNKGEVVRFYVTNVANTRMFNFSIPGVQLKLIGADIGSYEKEEYVDYLIIAPSQRYTIEAYFRDAGEFELMHINPYKEYSMGSITVLDEKTQQDYSLEFLSLRENSYVIEDINNFREYFEKEVDVQIDLSVEMEMGSSMLDGLSEEEKIEHCEMMPQMSECSQYLDEDHEIHVAKFEWEDEMAMMNAMSTDENINWILRDSISQKENMDIDLDFNVGDKVKIRLYNDPNSAHPMQHPIHFHGQRFLVLEKDGEMSDNLVWKDTVLVPVGSSVDI